MIYFFYKEDNKNIFGENKLIGSFAISINKEGEIAESKFKFDVIKFEENLTDTWNFAFKEGKNEHRWIGDYSEVPEVVSLLVKAQFEKVFSEELEKYSKEDSQPDFLNITSSELVLKIKEQVMTDNPTELQLKITFSMTLIKIASFLQENPHLVFEFPLYLEYIKKHNLSKSEFSVEDFLEDILSSAAVGL